MNSGPSGRISMEDFRPKFLSGIVGQDAVVTRLQGLANGVRSGRIVPPNLLLHGPPGIGKTTAARAFAREVLGEQFDNSFYQLRASDDRGIGVVRDGIIPLSRQPPKRGAPFRVFFFDEADALEPPVQSALRSAMEEGWGTTVFILACNDLGSISAPMRSRCMILEFRLVPAPEMRRLLTQVVTGGSLSIDGPLMDSIVERSEGIPREAIKLLVETIGRSSASGGAWPSLVEPGSESPPS
jgi:replication factor C small subunit